MTDIERYAGGLDLPNDPLAAALVALAQARLREVEMARAVAEVAAQTTDLAAQVEQVVMESADNRDWMTLRGFVKRYAVDVPDSSDAGLSRLGMQVKAWHDRLGYHYDQGGAFSSTYGKINKWQVRHLYTFFTSSGYTLNRAQYESDRPGR